MSDSPSLDLSPAEEDFIQEVLNEYAAIFREIDYEDRPEHDVVPRLINHLFINVLGHDESDYEQENDWNDVIIKDDDGNAVIVIEAKRRSVPVEEGIDQGFDYAGDRSYVEYFISTNINQLRLYEACDQDHPDAKTEGGFTARPVAEINFEGLVNFDTGRAVVSSIDIEEYQELLELFRLQREEVADVSKFDDFDLPPGQINDVTDDDGFQNLLEALEKSINEYFMPFSLKQFDEFEEKHQELEQQHKQLEDELKSVQQEDAADEDEVAELKTQITEIEDEWEPYRRFRNDYEVWKQLSNRTGDDEDENKRIFCRESVYTQINKILFIRIAEDKDLLNQMVSNGGVNQFFDFWTDYAKYTGKDKDYTDLFAVACDEMTELYEHLYSGSIFDWQLRDGSDLNKIFQKTFWHLNHYDFSNVDRDLLGDLYEKHLPKEERKTLGEFYTPTSVVNFILDELDYTADKPIENKTILDPATGSGTFLVQAANRLVQRLENKGTAEDEPIRALETVRDNLHGLDLNPFAVNIAQINLVFQILELYTRAKDKDPDYTIDNFKIYQTDSLKRGVDSKISGWHSDTVIQRYQRDKERADSIKSNTYDIVVGNPPYVYYNNIPKGQRETYNDAFENVAHAQYDILVLFIYSVKDWLKPGGQVGYITSNKFINAGYGKELRRRLPRYVYIDEFIDFADADVFEDAVNYPCVFTMTRKTEEEEANTEEYSFPFVGVKQEMEDVDALLEHIKNHLGEEYQDDHLEAFPVLSDSLDAQSWKFIPKDDTKVLTAIKEGAERDLDFEDLCQRVELGIKTGEDDAFVVSQNDIDQYDLEEEIIHPTLVGEDVKRWRQPEAQDYLIYADPNYDIDDYPNIKRYLDENYRDDLDDRTHVDQWWELREPRRNAADGEPKILTPDIAYYNNFTYDETGAFPLNTCYYATPRADAHYLLGVANSTVMQFYMRKEAPTYRGSFLRYYGDIWGSLPMSRDDDLEDKISEKSKEIVGLYNEIDTAQKVLEKPSQVYEELGLDTQPLARHPAIESYDLNDTEVGKTNVDGTKLQFQDLTGEIQFFDDHDAIVELVSTLIRMTEFESAEEITELPLPENTDTADETLAALIEAEDTVEEAKEDALELHEDLDELVFDLYDFNDEVREIIQDRTPTPTNPLKTRVSKD